MANLENILQIIGTLVHHLIHIFVIRYFIIVVHGEFQFLVLRQKQLQLILQQLQMLSHIILIPLVLLEVKLAQMVHYMLQVQMVL